MKWLLGVCLLLLIAATIQSSPAEPGEDSRGSRVLRRPVAMVVLNDRLLVGNQRAGSISVVNPSNGKIENEVPVGQQLSDLVALPDHRGVLALNEAAGQAVIASYDPAGLQVQQRIAVGTSPARDTL